MEQWTIRQDYFSPTQLFLWESAIYEHCIELEDNKIFMKHEIQITEDETIRKRWLFQLYNGKNRTLKEILMLCQEQIPGKEICPCSNQRKSGRG